MPALHKRKCENAKKGISLLTRSGQPMEKGVQASSAWRVVRLRRGYQSRDALAEMITAGSVSIIRQGQDRYGRTLARVVVNGKGVAAVLVSVGLARRWP